MWIRKLLFCLHIVSSWLNTNTFLDIVPSISHPPKPLFGKRFAAWYIMHLKTSSSRLGTDDPGCLKS
jgi:hypothetical protein